MKAERSMLILNTPWGFKRGAVARAVLPPIRYRASRVYFGARYYRGVDFIVNIYEGGSPGCSRAPALSSPSSSPPPPSTFLLSTPTWRSCLLLLPPSRSTYYPSPPGRIFPRTRSHFVENLGSNGREKLIR